MVSEYLIVCVALSNLQQAHRYIKQCHQLTRQGWGSWKPLPVLKWKRWASHSCGEDVTCNALSFEPPHAIIGSRGEMQRFWDRVVRGQLPPSAAVTAGSLPHNPSIHIIIPTIRSRGPFLAMQCTYFMRACLNQAIVDHLLSSTLASAPQH